MNEHSSARERRDDLLVQQATSGLSADEQRELNRLLTETNGDSAIGDFQLPAAAIDVAIASSRMQEPPAWLRDAVVARIASQGESKSDAGVARSKSGWTAPPSRREVLALACAAGIGGIAAFVWFSGRRESPAPSPHTQLQAFLREPPKDLVRLAWSPTEDRAAATASGEVVWSDSAQKGFMIFRGLPVNDASREQYQLWIFDETRDAAQPVDGGVFDIAAEQDAAAQDFVVPIRAKLPVRQATMFAVTIEPPGGVVVSKRERLPLLAKVGE